MRPVLPALDLFRGDSLPQEHAREPEVIDRVLCDNPTITRRVWKDLQGEGASRHERRGRPGVSADVTLRAAIIKQMNGFSYEELAFHRQVVSQAHRRVLNGQSVAAEEKLVSIFEPHTDIAARRSC